MKDKIKFAMPAIYLSLFALFGLSGASYFYARSFFPICAGVAIVVSVFVLLLNKLTLRSNDKYMRSLSKSISDFQAESLIKLPIPVLVTNQDEIIWYNDNCAVDVLENQVRTGESIKDFFENYDSSASFFESEINGKRYSVFSVDGSYGTGFLRTFYFYDITVLNHEASEYKLSRPSIWAIAIDSVDEVLQDAKENERSQLLSQVEYQIEKFFDERNGIAIKTHRGSFVAVLEERHMDEVVEKRFQILDNVRELNGSEGLPLTLSIGVSRNCENLQEGELAARQALDMSLGRGGDQAAEKTSAGYNFYGGLSKGIEKRTKVKTRIVATALSELVETSFNVIIMGHRFADLDALGSAVGLMRAIRQKGKSCVVAINRQKSLVLSDIERLEANGFENSFVSPGEALSRVTGNTLLIVVDTHLVNVVESKELYEACKNVVVIDHHRRMVGYIENAVIFYHEPYASSASEMVTELIQYFNIKNPVGRVEAEALLAGIMLDTRNFVLRTGVRTFEAAAYLRRQGADTVGVRKMFSSSMEAYQLKANIVSSAEIHKRCAVACTSIESGDMKIAAPQAADELLGISGVDASFVVFKTETGVSISGRSMGAFNVQLIMEALGGGGHQTMAATQIPDISVDGAKKKLLAAITDYVDKNINIQ